MKFYKKKKLKLWTRFYQRIVNSLSVRIYTKVITCNNTPIIFLFIRLIFGDNNLIN